MPFSTKNNQDSLEKKLIPRFKQENYKMSQEHPPVPEIKEALTGQGKRREKPA